MRFFTILPVVVASLGFAKADHGRDHNEDSTITSSAELACATGDAQSKYVSCSSSISSKIDECSENDYKCACSHAQDGFNCLRSYCITHTEALCAASYILNNLCAAFSQPGPSFTEYACPTSVLAALTSLIPTDIESIISSEMGRIPSGIPFFNNGPGKNEDDASASASEGSTSAMASGSGSGSEIAAAAPSQTGAARGGFENLKGRDGDGLLRGFLGVGIFVAVTVAGLAAFL